MKDGKEEGLGIAVSERQHQCALFNGWVEQCSFPHRLTSSYQSFPPLKQQSCRNLPDAELNLKENKVSLRSKHRDYSFTCLRDLSLHIEISIQIRFDWHAKLKPIVSLHHLICKTRDAHRTTRHQPPVAEQAKRRAQKRNGIKLCETGLPSFSLLQPLFCTKRDCLAACRS
jgi:hypothetical protein